jgi:hypothetical protein
LIDAVDGTAGSVFPAASAGEPKAPSTRTPAAATTEVAATFLALLKFTSVLLEFLPRRIFDRVLEYRVGRFPGEISVSLDNHGKQLGESFSSRPTPSCNT